MNKELPAKGTAAFSEVGDGDDAALSDVGDAVADGSVVGEAEPEAVVAVALAEGVADVLLGAVDLVDDDALVLVDETAVSAFPTISCTHFPASPE